MTTWELSFTNTPDNFLNGFTRLSGLTVPRSGYFFKVSSTPDFDNKILSTTESGFEAQNLLKFCPEYCKNERDGEKKSEDYKIYSVESKLLQRTLASLLNSNLFYSWFVTYSDVYHCGRELILDFPVDLSDLSEAYGTELSRINSRLMNSFRANSVRRSIPYKSTGLVEYDEFYPRLSKLIIDEIDVVLAKYYGFTDEELDFIINYDIKYRMGRDTDGEE